MLHKRNSNATLDKEILIEVNYKLGSSLLNNKKEIAIEN